ncbi:ATP-binding cassette domain-containing protein [Leucobacter sp. W1153]|uniref:ATP-binding cassette domain-containing protein n=1 Tax=Leucobacter sp. W1153 TaxID=3439064 RepID=UPI003F3C73E1
MAHPGVIWGLALVAAVAGAVAPAPWLQIGIMAAGLLACLLAARIHAPALRFGVWGAIVFVALRIVYRVLFAPVIEPPESAIVIFALPTLPLGGPFQGISLFGTLTLDQLLSTLIEASRFAVVFVVFGAANALADARTLLAGAPQPFLPVATSLALALGSVPALLLAGKRVDRAARMRGERRGPRLLIPVLEQAVERATTLGASMELRGYGAKRPRSGQDSHVVDPLVRVDELTVSHGGRVILDRASFVLRAGELSLITGPTGSGKSSLLAALAGLTPSYTGGSVTGDVRIAGIPVLGEGVDPRPARVTGMLAHVPQRVEHSFLAETVRAELEFAPRSQGLTDIQLGNIVDTALRQFDLDHLAGREPGTLSAGEATRLALASAVTAKPRVLLLDEPIADLDPHSLAVVQAALQTLLEQGCAALVAEHRPEALAGLGATLPVQWLHLNRGRVILAKPSLGSADSVSLPARMTPSAGLDPSSLVATEDVLPVGDPLVLARDLVITRGGRELLRLNELTVNSGEVTLLRGVNGSGKTSLLEDIALPPGARGGGRAAGCALVPQRVDDLLIRDTIEAECDFADRRAGAPTGDTLRRFAALIARPAVIPAPHTHPRDASAGTRLALAIAVQLSGAPRVLLLDEPTRGLDLDARRRLATLLAELASAGTAVMLATHDDAFAGLLAGVGARVRARSLSDGQVS